MRIAYLLVDPGIGLYGTKGASVHVQEVIRGMRAAGHRVTVFCTRLDSAVPDDLADLRVVHLPVAKRLPVADREAMIAAAGSALAAVAADAEFDLVYERYSLFSSAGAELADQLEVPLVVEVNAPLVAEQREHRELVDETAAWEATSRTFGRADRIGCVSRPVADWVCEVAPEAVSVTEVVPNGVNTERIRVADLESRQDASTVTVGFVGTLKPWHGTERLVRAVARVDTLLGTDRRVCLDVVGTGPEQESLVRLAEELGIADRVRFRGAVAPSEVPDILATMDIAVAPYPYGDHYFSPLKVYEYLAAGLPVVASAIGEIPTLLDDGRLGVLVTPGEVDELATALAELARDGRRRVELGTAARASAVAEHDWRIRCRDLLAPVPERIR
ncbi:MAG TPA: glycosyltransferase family 4 protein [Candidatus Avipropionibacterium avicola]|uniref:Glycosyltransferase family 4 protein n=1 Tax=Candidatus Avipropionibacterium avicola TaxID=2840701 RepID=A0A9D1GY30_9ACTN|nr:glycosyltransferase family 4 protein [Candidatus Avipropionibacterium avicola]